MKTTIKLMVTAFFCLSITYAFAGLPNPDAKNKPSGYKKITVRIKNSLTFTSCYADVYLHDAGPGSINGVYGEVLNAYVELVTDSGPIGGAAVVVGTNTTFTLDVMLGPPGSTVVTNIPFTIASGHSTSGVQNAVAQRSVSASDVTGNSYSPDGSVSGLYIDLNGYNPFPY